MRGEKGRTDWKRGGREGDAVPYLPDAWFGTSYRYCTDEQRVPTQLTLTFFCYERQNTHSEIIVSVFGNQIIFARPV